MPSRFADFINLAVRAIVPTLSVFLFSLVSLVPVPIEDYARVAPVLGLAAMYCWLVWRPDLLPYGVLFAIGLVEDALRGLPLGVTALGFVLVEGFVRAQQRALKGLRFELFWAVFALSAFLFGLVGWSVMSLYEGRILPAESAAIQLLITTAAFPAVAWLLLRVFRQKYTEN